MNPRPWKPSRVFPDVEPILEVQTQHRVLLEYDNGHDRLVGTLGDVPVTWLLVRHRRVSGLIGSVDMETSWTSGDNYVPEPGGWIPRPDYVSDFPNIPANLTGSFADRAAESHGVFHLGLDYAFQRGSIIGRVGAVELEATVLAASGGLCDGRTVVVEGTYGSVWFEVYGTIDASLSQGILYGKVEDATVRLELSRSTARIEGRALRPGPRIHLSGCYDGPPELLAVMVGAVLQFF
jgi:hypothetical protein